MDVSVKVRDEACLNTSEDVVPKNVALKIKDPGQTDRHVEHEYRVLLRLQGGVGVPRVFYLDRIVLWDTESIAVTYDLLGDTLNSLFESCGGVFSLKTVLMLADQMIACLHFVHSRDVVHRNIKTQNFIMGKRWGPHETTVFLIDYKASGRYRNPKPAPPMGRAMNERYRTDGSETDNGIPSPLDDPTDLFAHIPFRKHLPMIGTTRFASVAALRGHEQGRKDDLESLGYMLIYFLKGCLPWQGVSRKIPDGNKYLGVVRKMKARMPVKELCLGLPNAFHRYMEYCSGLQFEDDPDYDMLRRMFRRCFFESGFVWDNMFDWMRAPGALTSTSSSSTASSFLLRG